MGRTIFGVLFFFSGMSVGLIMGLVLAGLLRSAAKSDAETDDLITKPKIDRAPDLQLTPKNERVETP